MTVIVSIMFFLSIFILYIIKTQSPYQKLYVVIELHACRVYSHYYSFYQYISVGNMFIARPDPLLSLYFYYRYNVGDCVGCWKCYYLPGFCMVGSVYMYFFLFFFSLFSSCSSSFPSLFSSSSSSLSFGKLL